MHAPLREAARRAGMTEEEVRRKILLGEIAAVPVDDDRQYLVRLEDVGIASPRPAAQRRSCGSFFFLKIAFALFLLTFIAALVTTAMSRKGTYSLCLNCAAVRHDARTCCGLEGDSLTEAIRYAEPGTCRHEWVSLFPRTGRSLRFLAEEMDRLGIVEAARKVDPKGAAELVRWCLGRDWVSFAEQSAFKTREEFRAWFADLRARAEAR